MTAASEHQSEAQKQAHKPENNNTKAKPIDKPKGWIRWSGLAFTLVGIALFSLLMYWLSGWAVKSQIERVASNAWGAKVEIQSLSLRLNPLAFEMRGLAVTDTEQPMQNLVVVDRAYAQLNLYHLVVGRVVLDELALTGLALNQPRTTSGALKHSRVSGDEAKTESSMMGLDVALPSFDLPNPDAILARESLQTLEQAQALEQLAAESQQEWQQIQQQLPTQQKINEYKQRVSALFDQPINTLADVQQRRAEFEQLQKSFEQDYAALQQAQQFLRTRSNELRTGLTELRNLPQQDINRLVSRYTLDESGLSNLTYLLFGETIQHNLNLALDWYRKAQPLIAWLEAYRAEKAAEAQARPQRQLGEFVSFTEFDPQPDFMIKRASFEAMLDWGGLQIDMQNINVDHALSQTPVQFSLVAQSNTQPSPLTVEGDVFASELASMQTRAKVDWPNYQIQHWAMLQADALPLVMEQAMAQVKGRIKLTGVSAIEANLDLAYQGVDFDLSASQSNEVRRYIAPVFEQIDRFDVKASLNGDVFAPAIRAASDLDRQLSGAFRQAFQQEVAAFKQDLTQQLQQKLEQTIEPMNDQLAQFGLDGRQLTQLSGDISDLDKAGEQQLNQLQSDLQRQLESQGRQRLEDTLRDNIRLPF